MHNITNNITGAFRGKRITLQDFAICHSYFWCIKLSFVCHKYRLNCKFILLIQPEKLINEEIYPKSRSQGCVWFHYYTYILSNNILSFKIVLLAEDQLSPFLLVKDTFENTFKKNYKRKIWRKNIWKISSLDDSSKLFLYSKLKTDIKLEDYLKLTKKLTIDNF